MKKLIIIAALALISTLPVQAVTFQELNPYNGYMQIPNPMGEIQFIPIESLVTEKDNGNKLEIILPVYGYNNGDTAISSSTKRFTYDFINHTITMEIIETTFYDGRSGRVIFHSFIKKPKRVELQPNTYGYLEAMGALGNAQRTGKYTPKTHN